MDCYADGSLRAYADGAPPPDERAAIAAHLDACPDCRSRLAEQRVLTAQVAALLPSPPAIPDPRDALARLRAVAPSPGLRNVEAFTRRKPMSRLTSRRPLFAGLAVLLVLIGLLAFPPVRAAANQLLSVFRVQRIVFVPTNAERIQQLQNLNFDKKSLFVATPKVVNKPAQPRTVNSVSDVFGAVGFAFRQPSAFPTAPTSTQFVIRDHTVAQFQVDVASARQLLSLMDVNDVTLPDALGSKPVTVDVAPSVEARYRGDNYQLTLYQGKSPTVTLPDGVDLAQLGKAALRVLGMDAQQADDLSRQIDWSSTLIFPFPTDVSNLQAQQVNVGSSQGLLMGGVRGRRSNWQLYWQQGDQFYMLQAQGDISSQDVLAAAESVR